MIKTPVSTYFDKDVYPYPQIDDADSNFISECNKEDTAKEIVKRINMHDELALAVDELIPLFANDVRNEEDVRGVAYFYEPLER